MDYTEDVNEIMEEVNVQVEDILDEYGNSGEMDLIIPILRQQAHFFIENLQEELAKLELIES